VHLSELQVAFEKRLPVLRKDGTRGIVIGLLSETVQERVVFLPDGEENSIRVAPEELIGLDPAQRDEG